MMDFEFIEGLIRALDDSSIDSLEIERGGTRIRLAKSPTTVAGPVTMAAPPAVAAAAVAPASAVGNAPPIGAPATSVPTVASNLLEITSPMVGTFYLASAPDAPDYVDIGGRVSPGDTLCIIEAMKLMNELECEISGRIAEICVANAQPVEFGQVLFRVDPS